ncbi:MAG: hypothetical protein ACTHOG_09035 [Marmoricola sp.]
MNLTARLRPEHLFLLAAVGLAIVPWHLVNPSGNAVVVFVAVLAGISAAFGLRAARGTPSGGTPVASIAIGGMLVLFILTNAVDALGDFSPLPGRWGAVAILFVALCVLTALSAWLPFPRVVTFALLGGAMVAMTVLAMELAATDIIDVSAFNSIGTRTLLHGHNPYAPIYPNVYAGTAHSDSFYGPGVALSNGMLAYGYPYPPIVLLMQAPFELFHAYKAAWAAWPALAAGVLAAVMPRGHATYRLAPLLIVLAPFTMAMTFWTWVEPLALALLVLTAVAGVKKHASFPWLLGLTLVSKQYFVVCAPLLLLLLPLFRELGLRRCITRMIAAAALVTLPFAALDPTAFWRAIVTFQLAQPYRADSLSLAVLLHNDYGWLDPALLGVLPLALGVGVAGLLAWKAPRTIEGFVGSVGITLLVTILFSKQAFGNYYALVEGCFLLAAILLIRQRGMAAPPPAAEPATDRH